METERAAHADGFDELGEEGGQIFGKLGELIDDNEQVGERLPIAGDKAFAADLEVVLGDVFLATLQQEALATDVFGFDGFQGTQGGGLVQVGDGTDGVGKIAKNAKGAVTFEVDK